MTHVVPSSGPNAGGNRITIVGTPSTTGDVTAVTMCGAAITDILAQTPTSVEVLAPAHVPQGCSVVTYSSSRGLALGAGLYMYNPCTCVPSTRDCLFCCWHGCVVVCPGGGDRRMGEWEGVECPSRLFV